MLPINPVDTFFRNPLHRLRLGIERRVLIDQTKDRNQELKCLQDLILSNHRLISGYHLAEMDNFVALQRLMVVLVLL